MEKNRIKYNKKSHITLADNGTNGQKMSADNAICRNIKLGWVDRDVILDLVALIQARPSHQHPSP